MSGFDFLVAGFIWFNYKFFILKDREFIVAHSLKELGCGILLIAVVFGYITAMLFVDWAVVYSMFETGYLHAPRY